MDNLRSPQTLPGLPTNPPSPWHQQSTVYHLQAEDPQRAEDNDEMEGENTNVGDLVSPGAENLGDQQWAGSHAEPREQRGNCPSTNLDLQSSQASLTGYWEEYGV